MMKKMKTMFASIIALYLLGGSITVAAGLDENMQTLAKNMSILQSSTDKKEILESLDIMGTAVNDAMKTLPEKISPDDKQGRDEYINELRRLEKEILQAREKVESGKLSDIRDSVNRMNDIRVEGHNKFR
ncbi:TPA: cytochrome b562 [Escherichia coli]